MKKIPVWKNVVLVSSTVVVLVVAAFAWFYTGLNADMGQIATDIGYASYIQISGDNGNNWSERLELDVGVNKNFKEISGNGSSFYAPVYDVIQNAEGGYSTQLISFDNVNGSEFHYEHIIDLRTDTVQNVYLSGESTVTSVGNGYIDGAIRVAFFVIDEKGNETLACIWAPNSLTEFNAETNSFSREGSIEPCYYYQISPFAVDVDAFDVSNSDVVKIPTEETDEMGCGYNSEYKFIWSNGQNMPLNAPAILTVDRLGDDYLYYSKLKIKVWLEGHDRECVSLLSGQKFIMNLQFVAEEGE